MTLTGTAEELPAAPSSRWLAGVARQLLIGTRVASVCGALTGSSAAVYLVAGHYSELVLPTWGSRLIALLHLSSAGGLAAAAALLPLEILLGTALHCSTWLRDRLSPRRVYISTYGVGLLAALGFLELAFNRVRDLKTVLGVATVASFVLLPALAILWLNLRSPSPRRQVGRPRLSAALWTLASLSLLGVIFSATTPLLSSARRSGTGISTVGHPPATIREIASEGPAVLLVSIDTLRADHLGAYGYHRRTTPNLDTLAAEGVLFERAYTPSSWTLPAHATMLTGLYPAHHGVRFADVIRFLNSRSTDVLGAANVTLAEMLAAGGYSTAAFTSNRWLSSAFGFEQGFDLLESNDRQAAGPLVDRAIAWLDSAGSAPFFLFLHLFDVHEYAAPDSYFRRFHPDDYSGQVAGREWKTMGNLWQRLSADDLTYIEGKYDGALSYVDSELGRLLAELRRLGRFHETLIVVTSDHGEEFLDHGATGHGQTLYEELLRVPLLLKPPRGTGRHQPRIESPAALVDLVPTILDYAGLPAGIVLDGVSLRRSILGGPAEARSLHFGDVFYQNRAAILDGDHKFIANRLPPLEPFRWRRALSNLRTFFKFEQDELYDLATDPEERHNLLSTRPELAARLRARLLDHQRTSRPGTVRTMDAETIEQLRALGYLD